jgi:NAD(P)-dependent dehydrogenase (short-subunit alcohol dehydrogenase family)
MSLVSIVRGRHGASGFGYASTAEEVTEGLDLRGKHVLVTGMNSGLGLETVRVLGKRGARIVGLARTKDKAAEALRSAGAEGEPFGCELSEPGSVRACAEAVIASGAKLDAMILNAGIMALPERIVKHGHELQFLTNHVGHFLLVAGLLGRLADDARVVALSSAAHRGAPSEGIVFEDLSLAKGYSPWRAYGQSKLANVLFARALATRFAGTKKTANAVHPGVIATNLGRYMSVVGAFYKAADALFLKNVGEGAATQCFVAVHPSLAAVSGEYFADCNVARSTKNGANAAMAERLWAVTEEIAAKL